jgi:Ras-related protein Rab-2A
MDLSSINCEIINEDCDAHFNYKVIIVGDAGVGKSCINSRIIKNTFDTNYAPTIGFEYTHLFMKANDKIIKLSLWDTCGQEIYRSLVSSFYRNGAFAILVYSINSRESFDNLEGWLNDIRTSGSVDVKMFLIGNKKDLEENRAVTYEEGERFAKEHGFIQFFETSAMTGENVKDVFVQIGKASYMLPLEEDKSGNKSDMMDNIKGYADFGGNDENGGNYDKMKGRGCC